MHACMHTYSHTYRQILLYTYVFVCLFETGGKQNLRLLGNADSSEMPAPTDQFQDVYCGWH